MNSVRGFQGLVYVSESMRWKCFQFYFFLEYRVCALVNAKQSTWIYVWRKRAGSVCSRSLNCLNNLTFSGIQMAREFFFARSKNLTIKGSLFINHLPITHSRTIPLQFTFAPFSPRTTEHPNHKHLSANVNQNKY